MSPLESAVYSRRALADLTPPARLLPGILDVGSLAVLASAPASLAALTGLSLACAVSCDRWEMSHSASGARVLYVAAGSSWTAAEEVAAWERATGTDAADNRLLVASAAPRLLDPGDVHALVDLLEAHGVQLLVLASWSRCLTGGGETTYADATSALAALTSIRSAGVAVVVCDGANPKVTGPRGVLLSDLADSVWVVRERQSSAGYELAAADGPFRRPAPFPFALVESGGTAALIPQ